MGGEENEVSREQLTLEMDPTGGAKSMATLGAQRAQSQSGKQAGLALRRRGAQGARQARCQADGLRVSSSP